MHDPAAYAYLGQCTYVCQRSAVAGHTVIRIAHYSVSETNRQEVERALPIQLRYMKIRPSLQV